MQGPDPAEANTNQIQWNLCYILTDKAQTWDARRKREILKIRTALPTLG